MTTKTQSIEEMRDDICAQLAEHELALDLGGDYAMNKEAAGYYRDCEDWSDEKIRLEHAKLFEYAPDPPERSPEQLKRAAKVQERINNYPRAKAWEVETVFEGAPEGDFSWEPDEAGDWHAIQCGEKDCPVGWHQEGYILNIKREKGKRIIELMAGDMEGDWSCVDSWEDGMKDLWLFEEIANQNNDFFKGWASYYLHCFHGGKDVLEPAREQSPEDWLKAAEEMLQI